MSHRTGRASPLLTVLRDNERNPVRERVVAGAEDWPWSSARAWRESLRGPRVEAGPVARPEPWLQGVNESMADADVQQIRQSLNRVAPCGSETWVTIVAAMLGLEASLRPIGRPEKLLET